MICQFEKSFNARLFSRVITIVKMKMNNENLYSTRLQTNHHIFINIFLHYKTRKLTTFKSQLLQIRYNAGLVANSMIFLIIQKLSKIFFSLKFRFEIQIGNKKCKFIFKKIF